MTLLQRFLTWYDPLFGGFTPAGIAAGVDLLNGFGWCAPNGLAILFRGATAATIDQPVGAAGPEADSIAPRSGVEIEPGVHFFQAIPYGPGGYPAVVGSPQQVFRVVYGENGAVLPVPPAPRHLRVMAIAGGCFKLQWTYLQAPSRPRAAKFNVYSDGGGGTVNYGTAVGAIDASLNLNGEYTWTGETEYSHRAAVKFGVRAETADGREEENTIVATGVADNLPPDEAEIVDYTELDDE